MKKRMQSAITGPLMSLVLASLVLISCAPAAEHEAEGSPSTSTAAAPTRRAPTVLRLEEVHGLITSDGINDFVLLGDSRASVVARRPSGSSPGPDGTHMYQFGRALPPGVIVFVCESTDDVGALIIYNSPDTARFSTAEGLEVSSTEAEVAVVMGEPAGSDGDADAGKKVVWYDVAPDRRLEFEFRNGAVVKVSVLRLPSWCPGD